MNDLQPHGEVDSLCERLKSTKLKNEEIFIDLNSIEEVLNKGKNYILVKLLSANYYNRKAFKATMKKVWHPSKTLKFVEMDGDMMMAKCESQNDKQRVMRDNP